MKSVWVRLVRLVPIKPLMLLAVFVTVQVLGLQVYVDHEDLVKNVRWSTVEHSYLPALLHAGTKSDLTSGEVQSERARSVPVLVYHGIVEQPDGANVLVEDFRKQMFGLKQAGYQAIALSDFADYMKGRKQLPAKSFLLTFDDGRKDSYYPVDPILKVLDYHATMFVITDHAFDTTGDESTYYLNRNELLRMKESGRWDLQAHTNLGHDLIDIDGAGKRGHFYSNLAWLKDKNRVETPDEFKVRVSGDLRGAKGELERQLDTKISAFAYPFGDFGQNTLNYPEAKSHVLAEIKASYEFAFAGEENLSVSYSHNTPDLDHRTLKRIKVYPDWSVANLVKVIEAGSPKKEFFRDTFNDHNGWVVNYGHLSLTGNGRLRLVAPESGTSAGMVLDGTADWRNYRYTASLSWPPGTSSVTLVARYKDVQNYVACTVTPTRVQVEQMANGVRKILAETKLKTATQPPDVTFSIVVNGSVVGCAGTAGAIGQADPATLPATGGIGLKIWDAQPQRAEISVREVVVTPV